MYNIDELISNYFTESENPLQGVELTYDLKKIKTKGRLVYEYNPLHNYRKNGEIVDFQTADLNLDVKHPMEINCQPSYDGTVNLILTDGQATPKLINSRFTVTENNTYEIIDRVGNSDTNLYDQEQFDADTSLTKQFMSIPKIDFEGTSEGGDLKVGNYVLYIKYADADDNETDIVAESGIISCFIGTSPQSIKGGYKDENSSKIIKISISNLDTNYDYLKIYYTRSTSDVDQNRYTTAYKILQKYKISNDTCTIFITGNESVEDTSVESLNVSYFVAKTIKTMTQCSNRLFIGNVTTGNADTEDLQDLSLRIYPTLVENDASSFIGELNYRYEDVSTSSNPNEYYNSQNIYYRVGYWNEEFYRFGIVYIMNNGTLSSVFNISGNPNITSEASGQPTKPVLDNDSRTYFTIDDTTHKISGTTWNCKGVCRLKSDNTSSLQVLGIKFNIPEDVITYLDGKVRGFFFVRQKRIPTKVAQMYLMPSDSYSGIPLLNIKDSQYYESFLTSKKLLNQTFSAHLRNTSVQTSAKSFTGICPEAEMYQPYYNQIFTGAKFTIKESYLNTASKNLTQDTYYPRHFYSYPTTSQNLQSSYSVNLGSIPDSAPLIVINDARFRASAGEASDALKFQYIGIKQQNKDAVNYVRGNWGPYIGVVNSLGGMSYGKYYDVYAQGFDNDVDKEFDLRYADSSEYMAIGDRYQIDQVPTKVTKIKQTYEITQYRGDCYICQFTHRIHRNFQDPSAPTNDDIISSTTWSENYDPDGDSNTEINRGDINAVGLGTWVTIKVYSTHNLSLRTEDLSYPTEQGTNGHARGFYPYQAMSVDGCYKIPESFILNDGFATTLGERWNYTAAEVPYTKNIFQTRIYYSDIAVNDAFKNGYRVFRSTNYRDYPIVYGGLVKMITCKSNIIAIFEHGICLLPVNERTQTAASSGGSIFINTNNVLPENPSSVISDKFGTQWPESVIQTPKAIYGVDTVAKKIWQINLSDLTLICTSDFKVQEFLNKNIVLSEFTTTPIIGVRNVKSHYNAFKQDVMFTFYNNTVNHEDTAWNICFNEISMKFVTFYSWIPSYSENIDNIFFSFDRNTSKWISKLATSKTGNAVADGITVDNVQIDTWEIPQDNEQSDTQDNDSSEPTEGDEQAEQETTEDAQENTIPYLSISNRNFDLYNTFEYEILKDQWHNYQNFEIDEDNDNKPYLKFKASEKYKEPGDLFTQIPVIYLNLKCTATHDDSNTPTPSIETRTISSTVALTLSSIIGDNTSDDNAERPTLNTYFWKHGQAGLLNIADTLRPTYWYGEQHPFEFEFVINEQPSIHKIFNNLQIISNNAEPESFHYQIIGDVYDFAEEKQNMYYRQEATKCLYQYLGSDITYDHDRLSMDPIDAVAQHFKSTIFPWTYYRKDSMDAVEDSYAFSVDTNSTWKNNYIGRDYQHLAGAEVTYNSTTGQYSIWQHSKAVNIKTANRLRGNMTYKEDRFDIQINPLIYLEKNENTWPQGHTKDAIARCYPPIVINGPLPNDILRPSVDVVDNCITQLANSEIPKFPVAGITNESWGYRKETKLRDKCMRVRVRYTGDKLAIITSILTLYTQSYG